MCGDVVEQGRGSGPLLVVDAGSAGEVGRRRGALGVPCPRAQGCAGLVLE
uniref:Uncharacterized protein n=1 Tax=Triticum urartu TaxID=4572 RepID=A0A8R7QXU9_TRIUA